MVADTDFVNVLGPLPILQLCAGIVILGICAFVWLRGAKDQPSQDDALQNMLRMDGPIAVTIATLRRIAECAEKAEGCLQTMLEEIRYQRRLLEEIRRQRGDG